MMFVSKIFTYCFINLYIDAQCIIIKQVKIWMVIVLYTFKLNVFICELKGML